MNRNNQRIECNLEHAWSTLQSAGVSISPEDLGPEPEPECRATRESIERPGSEPVDLADLRVAFRAPREADAAAIWQLVRRCDALDLNSPYAYLLLCTDFAPAGLVAYTQPPRGVRSTTGTSTTDAPADELAGFVLGYRRPAASDTLFVWQIGLDAAHRGKGLGGRLLDALVERCSREAPVEFLEATVTPSNQASRMLFTRFARERSASLHESIGFRSSSFPSAAATATEASDVSDASDASDVTEGEGQPHEDEIRLRIGPLRSGGDR